MTRHEEALENSQKLINQLVFITEAFENIGESGSPEIKFSFPGMLGIANILNDSLEVMYEINSYLQQVHHVMGESNDNGN